MEPSRKGVFKVAKCIRDQFNAGGKSKEKVLELFAQCDYDPDSALVYACFELYNTVYVNYLIVCFPEGNLREQVFCGAGEAV